MDLPAACLFLGCSNPCLRGLAGKPPRECLDEYREKAHPPTLRVRAMHHLREPPECSQCRVRDIDILSIDHIHGNGAKERRQIGNTRIYQKILGMTAEQARLEYQILCRNHNWKKHITNMRQQLATPIP